MHQLQLQQIPEAVGLKGWFCGPHKKRQRQRTFSLSPPPLMFKKFSLSLKKLAGSFLLREAPRPGEREGGPPRVRSRLQEPPWTSCPTANDLRDHLRLPRSRDHGAHRPLQKGIFRSEPCPPCTLACLTILNTCRESFRDARVKIVRHTLRSPAHARSPTPLPFSMCA